MNISVKFKDLLKEKGYKLTTQRRAVLDVLQNHLGEHLTTEEIYQKVKLQCPEIGLATVYRTVQLLEEMNLIDRLTFDDGCNRYELGAIGDDHHHHHLICDLCSQIFEVAEDLMDEIEIQVETKYKFQVKNHKVKFYGICHQCHTKKHPII